MKQVKSSLLLGIAAAMMMISSCQSAGEKNAAETPAADTTAKKDVPPPPPAPGPKMVMSIKHEVADYAKWKSTFDNPTRDSIRKSYGLHKYVVARGIQDSNMVLVAEIMDDPAKAREMAASQGLKDRMKAAGVKDPVAFDYLDMVMNDTTNIQQTARVVLKFKVKDWDAWKQGFDRNKHFRVDAGLTDRVVAHTVGDNHAATVVFAVSDVDKAMAYFASKDVKDRMVAGGIEGTPTYFYYRIVALY